MISERTINRLKENKKICFVVPSLHIGGMERVMSELANYFVKKPGLEIHIVLYGKSRSVFYPIIEKINIHKPAFIFSENKRSISTVKTLLFIRRTLKKIKPDAVLSFGETYNSFVLLSAMFLNFKIFVSDRSKPDKSWGIKHELLRKFIYPKSRGIIAQTNFSKTFLQKETKHRNIHVIPNPIDIKSFKINEREKIVLNVGRLISTKKIDILLEIFCRTKNTGWTLWIVGDGPERSQLEDKVVELNISDKVKFWGSQKEIERFYSQASIFAFTSVSEGFPNALLEAMASGLPCISFDCVAGPADIIRNNLNGFLIPEMDTDKYLSKLQLLMNNVELRNEMGKQALQIVKDYHISKIGEEYLKFMIS